MKRYRLLTVIALMLVGVASTGIARDVLIPSDDFLVIVGDSDTVLSLHERFSKQEITLLDYAKLVGEMNPATSLFERAYDEPLAKNNIVHLPGLETLSKYKKEVLLGAKQQEGGTSVQRPSKPELAKSTHRVSISNKHSSTGTAGQALTSVAEFVQKEAANEHSSSASSPSFIKQSLSNEDESYATASLDRSHVDARSGNGSAEADTSSDDPNLSANSHTQHGHMAIFAPATINLCLTKEHHSELAVQISNTFGSSFSEHLSQSNIEQLRYFLTDSGYLDAHISHDDDGVTYILPHDIYLVTKIIIEPTDVGYTDEDSQIRTVLAVNKVYSESLERIAKTLATDWLAENGFPLVNSFAVTHRRNSVNATVEIVFTYEPSPAVNIVSYEQYGERNFHPNHLEILSPFSESPRFSLSDLDAFRSRLMATGYYSDVEFDLIKSDDASSENLTLGILTHSKETSNLKAYLGFSQGRNAVLYAEAALPNLTGHGDDLSLNVSLDSLSRTLSAEYMRHNVHQYGLDVGAATTRANNDNRYFERDLTSADFFLNWRDHGIDDGSLWHLGVSLMASKEINKRLAGSSKKYEYWQLSVGRSGRPEWSEYVSAWSIQADYNIGSRANSLDFWSLNADFSGQLGLAGATPVEWRTALDVLHASSVASIPAGSQLYAGGSNSNRGYEPFAYSSLDAQAKSLAYTVSSQVEIPITWGRDKSWISRVSPFLDATILGTDLVSRSNELLSIGLGVSGTISSFPIRLDVATPLTGSARGGVNLNFQIGMTRS